MDNTSVGFVGCGGIARSHTKALMELGNVDFVGFCDIVEERARAYADEYGGETYADFSEMYEKEEMEAVYICLPPFAHTNEVELAAERGINVFIQKPIALNMDLANRMVDAVEKAGVKSQVGYQLRFGKGIQMGKTLLEDAGRVTLATGRYVCNFIGGEWWKDPSRSGGQVVEQSTHVIDLLRYLCGEITRVSVEMDTLYWDEVEDMKVEDVSSTSLRFESGAVGSMVATTGGYTNKWIVDISVFTKKGVLDFPDPNLLSVNWCDREASEEHRAPGYDMSLAEARHFIGAIRQNTDTITPLSEGAKTLAVTLAIRESGMDGKPREIAL